MTSDPRAGRPATASNDDAASADSATREKVRVEAVSRVYRTPGRTSVTALEDVSLSVAEGEFVAIVGPSGCGKSTLLRLVAGLQQPTSGAISIDESADGRPATAMVFQDHALFPWRTVRRNVTFGLENRGVAKKTRRETADRQLARLGLQGFADCYPHQLSGGMKQRVGIARALAQAPEILLMDEPLGALDAQTRTLLQEQILELRHESNPTCLYVTHAIDEAVFLADRVVLMTARPGRIKEDVHVGFPRERNADIRGSAEFAALTQEIWTHLRSEVEATMAAEVPK